MLTEAEIRVVKSAQLIGPVEGLLRVGVVGKGR